MGRRLETSLPVSQRLASSREDERPSIAEPLPEKKSVLIACEAALRAKLESLGEAPELVAQSRSLCRLTFFGPPLDQKVARYLLVLRSAGKRASRDAVQRTRENP